MTIKFSDVQRANLKKQIDELRLKLLKKEKLLKLKQKKENLQIFNKIKYELPRLRLLINDFDEEKRIIIKKFLIENKFDKINEIFFS